MDVRSGVAAIGDGELHWEVAGSGPDVALVHGFTLDRRMWSAQFGFLARDHRVLRYDCRGFGSSSLPTETPSTHGEDLRILLGQLGMTPARIVGQSMGGQIALECAVRFPEVVERLVLIDPWLADFDFSPEWTSLLLRMLECGSRGDVAGAKALWWNESGLFSPARESETVAAELDRMVSDYSGWHFANLARMGVTPVSARVGEIQRPVLVVLGERDVPEFVAIADFLHRAIPGAEKRLVPGAGHMANMEAPEPVNRAIAAFLKDGPG